MILKPPLFAKPIHGHLLGPDGGLCGCWLMNEGSGNKVSDFSGGGNTGTFDGGPIWVPYKFGPGIDFNGSSAVINIEALSVMTKWSVVLWTTPDVVDATGTRYIILSNDQSGYMDDILIGLCPEGTTISTNKRFAMTHHDGGQDKRTKVEDTVDAVIGQDYFIAVTSDGAFLRLYIDGVLKDTTAKNGDALIFGSAPIRIAQNPNYAASYYDGRIDVPMIYNHALSQSEIAKLYREPFCMFERDPIELWSAATLGAPSAGNAGIMTPWGGYWGPTY